MTVVNLRYTVKMLCENMSGAGHRYHMVIIYVSFAYSCYWDPIFYLKKENEHLMKAHTPLSNEVYGINYDDVSTAHFIKQGKCDMLMSSRPCQR